ncbi:MAG: HPP family protein [Micrococcales bacterium]|nr:HPP family protein [Micrococcales bacterium]
MATWRRGRGGGAVYSAVLCVVVLAAAGAVGLALRQPWLFPSLGPTVMLFFSSPEQPSSRALNTLVGHLVGLVAGYGALLVFGLAGAPPASVGGFTPAYLLAAVAAVGTTTLVLHLLGLPHPPAGATTLIVALGILATPLALLDMFGAVVLITVVGWGLNRLLLGRRP